MRCFEENGLRYADKTKKVLFGVADGFNPTELVIPEGVEAIREEAFTSLKDLKKLTLPASLKELWGNFLYPCINDDYDSYVPSASDEIEGPNTVEIIAPVYESLDLYDGESEYFGGFGKIPVKKIVLKDDIDGTDMAVFKGWTQLEEVVAEGDFDFIDDSAFYGCVNLKSVTFNGKVSRILSRAFLGCDKLERINIPCYTTVQRTRHFGEEILTCHSAILNVGAFGGRNMWRNWLVDLGLPSGTFWARSNFGVYYHPQELGSPVMATDQKLKERTLPTIGQMLELRRECTWEYDDKQSVYKVTGPNGESILLPYPKDKTGEPLFAIYHCVEEEMPELSDDDIKLLGGAVTPDIKRYIREVGKK